MITTTDQERHIRERAVELDSMTTEVKPIGPTSVGAALVKYHAAGGDLIAAERVLPDGTTTSAGAWLEQEPLEQHEPLMSDHQWRCLQLLLNGGLAEGDDVAITTPTRPGEDVVVTAGDRTLEIPPEPRPDPMLDQASRMPYARMWGILYGDLIEMQTGGTAENDDVTQSAHAANGAYRQVRARMDALAGEAMLTGDPDPAGDGPPVCVCAELHRVGMTFTAVRCPVHPGREAGS